MSLCGPAVALYAENPDVLFSTVMLSLKWLKLQSLLPVGENRAFSKVLQLFGRSEDGRYALGSHFP